MQFEFLKQNNVKINVNHLKLKDSLGRNVLQFLLFFRIELKTTKRVFRFCKKHNPKLFLQKDKAGNSLLDYLLCILNYKKDIIKYILNFCILHFPFLFLEKKGNDGHTFFSIIARYKGTLNITNFMVIYNFAYQNFPEISNSTNNFILPLMMEIQN